MLSESGFLPAAQPLANFPVNYALADQLSELIEQLPTLLAAKKLRNIVDQLNTKYINPQLADFNIEEQNAAIRNLAMLAQAYIWEDFANPKNQVPAVIALNLYQLCKQQQRLPALNYHDYVLQNWRLIKPSLPITLDNIEPLVTFTNSADEKWFIKIHVVVEAICAPGLHAAHRMQQDLIKHLHTISDALNEASEVLPRMLEQCRPPYFWDVLRRYLFGWENVSTILENGQVEKGVRLEGVATKDKIPVHCYRGASGAQSSILPAFDAALGIKHEIDGMFQTMQTFQHYMPHQHQHFISLLRSSNAKNNIPDDAELKKVWQQAEKSLSNFRLAHLKLVNQYIFNPAKYADTDVSNLTGTGGAPILEYLDNRQRSSYIAAAT